MLRWMGVAFLGLVLTAVTVLAVLRVVQPGPPGRVVIATGGSGNAYHELASTFAADLARLGIDLELRPGVEGIDTLKALANPESAIDAGFVKGGFAGSLQGRLASTKARDWHDTTLPRMRSLGRLFYEPIWIFYRGSTVLKDLAQLRGKRIIVGTKQSGARRIATQLLKANRVEAPGTSLLEQDLADDGQELVNGEVDAAILILPAESQKVQKLLRTEGIRLMDMAAEADAYTTRFPSLAKLVLHQGSVELEPSIPATSTTLLATSTTLLVRADLHPALVAALTYAVVHNPKRGFDKEGDPILFHKAGEFPMGSDPEYELASDARPIYKSGELPWLLARVAPLNKRLSLPFGVSAYANAHGAQTVLLLIPALTILLPLISFLPKLYEWSVRQRLLYWYRQLKALEVRIEHARDPSDMAEHRGDIERIDAAVRRIRVPLPFFDQFYDLREHIDFVRRRLRELSPGLRAAE